MSDNITDTKILRGELLLLPHFDCQVSSIVDHDFYSKFQLVNSAALTQVSTVVFLQQLTFHMTAEREFSLGCVSGFEMNHTLLQNDKSARVTVSIMLSDT